VAGRVGEAGRAGEAAPFTGTAVDLGVTGAGSGRDGAGRAAGCGVRTVASGGVKIDG
jgi:hypothetical protein